LPPSILSQKESQQSASALQELMKAGAYPLQRASGFAEAIRDHSKRMSSKIATESMGYLEKVSGMWQGGVKHYGPVEGMPPDDDDLEGEDELETEHHAARFREHFALPDSEQLLATYFAYFYRVLPLYGKIYISNKHFCYRSLLPGTRTKLVLPLKDIEGAVKEKGYRPGYCGLVITIRGHEEIFFDFRQHEARDDCTVLLILSIEAAKKLKPPVNDEKMLNAETAKAENKALQDARHNNPPDRNLTLGRIDELDPEVAPVLFDDPRASFLNFKPSEPMRITCLTIGSRGDVQPYIALAKGLIAEGHQVKIATHVEFESWIRSHGIDFAPVSGDPGELMRICIDYGMFTYGFLREAHSKFRGWIDELLVSAWIACKDTDLLIESPSAMAGIHIAEALQIPYFRAFTMPWTRTRAYPHAFAVPEHKRGGPYNYFTYIIVEGVFWKGIATNINKWRKRDLKLGPTSLDKMQPNKVPFLYNFSPSVVAPPLDYSDWIRITGYWFLEEATKYKPPADLAAFIKKAKADKKKIVYIGFGSILVENQSVMTKTVVDAVTKADVRCVLAKGWSDRVAAGSKGTAKIDPSKPEPPLPADIFLIQSCPHDWLFPQMDAVAHHGGSGTTGASLRAGVPTIAKPFFGDQFFFGARLEDLGVGICLKKLNSTVFGRALWEATHSERMITRARVLGEQVRGVSNPVPISHSLSIPNLTLGRKTALATPSTPSTAISSTRARS
jgi:sterol 3beta-glucosyltransferase